MLRTETNCYAIPGWGFSAEIFTELDAVSWGLGELQLLDYYHADASSLAEVAAQLASNIAAPATLLGWSMGGLLAIKIASMYPEKIKRLILLASQPKMVADDHWPGIAQATAAAFVKNTFTLKTQQQFLQLVNFPNRQQSVRKILHQYNIIMQHPECQNILPNLLAADLRAEYAQLEAEIIQVVFSEDAVIAQDAAVLQQLNSKAKIIRIANAGHAGMLSHRQELAAACAKIW